MPSKYFLCVCTSRGRHARRTSRGCSRALHLSWRSFYVRVLRTAGLHHCAALDASAYQTGYNHLVANVEHIRDQIGLPVNITTTLHGNVDKAAHTVVTETMDLLSIDPDIQRFVTLKCFLSLFVTLLVTIVYVSLNVGLAIVWGMLTFILNWISNFGAMIESVAPICIIAITPSVLMNPMETFLAVFLSMRFHMFIGNFVEVKVFGKKLEIDPVIVILGLLWGVVGMILSIRG
ncbi:hypothetical protein PPTG_10701 [Phytophthora nicotianae INRA-310]|uniref:Uncharacterized protein n=1 Tax=Phytophthora nicotianae (strain INRA-310) TaxID=761204 RepID=W2QBN0_PHYN3|nr:hypothetical protein PPTG_10701 [Phytophthora nicotianae INRA-310]ETN10593.1 hypothetical protein PPTG_10701 [Phytophthora nicotianae INRA-310]